MAIEIREFRPGDEPALLRALNECCRREHPRAGQRTPEEWRWAFGENPAGRRIWLALDGERVLAHHAAMPRKVWLGREALFAELVDCFGPSARGLQKEGLYVRLGRALGENHGGAGGDAVHYGFPSGEREWRLANGRLDQEVVRDLSLLVRTCADAPGERPREVETLERFDEQARWLWDRCAGGFGASAVRDGDFLNWRFVQRPHVRYERLGVRDGAGILRGFAVLRSAEWASEPCELLVDWLVPPEEPEAGELLLRGALTSARGSGHDTLAAVLPEWSPWFERFQRRGFLALDGRARLCARSFARKLDEIWLRENWWFTLADTVRF